MEPGHRDNAGRNAQTVVQVLERGYYKGQPVTKVLLHPRTGRRHQLRIHCLCLGHPIVGDYTYNILHRHCVDQEDALARPDSESLAADRMMLHAYSLRYACARVLLSVVFWCLDVSFDVYAVQDPGPVHDPAGQPNHAAVGR